MFDGHDFRTCFFITPFGQPGSVVRARSDAIGAFLSAIMESRGLRLVRGDSTVADGDVLRQVVTELLDSAVVAADLTGCNPNVMYELGMADAFVKPVLRLVDDPAQLPFNIRNQRTLTLRSMPTGELEPASRRPAEDAVRQFLANALAWDGERSTHVTEARRALPAGFSEQGWFRVVGGFTLANGWEGLRKALAAAGADVAKWDATQPPVPLAQMRVGVIGALVDTNAELVLDFGDWTEEEILEYTAKVVDALVDCGSPYGVRVDNLRLRLEPGERMSHARGGLD